MSSSMRTLERGLEQGQRLARRGSVYLPWLLALAVACVALLQTGTPAVDIARYGAYWGFAVTLPGSCWCGQPSGRGATGLKTWLSAR